MKWIGRTAMVAALLLPVVIARAGTSPPQVGDTYEIVLTRESVQGGQGSSGSSHDRDTVVEQVTGVRADGLELEYDLPKSVTAEDRAGAWQFPFRVFKPFHGRAQLLNAPELESRIDAWLKASGLARAACGHWYFTWNTFRIECDPQSVLKTAEAFDLRSVDLRDGASYQEAGAIGPGTLAKKAIGPDGAIFTVELGVDPDAVHHARAESDVVVGEIIRKPVTPEAALLRHVNEVVSGTVSITFETDLLETYTAAHG